MDSTEKWLPAVGWEGYYEVSDQGRVRSASARHGTSLGRVLKPSPDKDGYLTVTLRHDGIVKNVKIHALVATAFIGPCPPGCDQIHHRNNSKSDNRESNLLWTDSLGNVQFAVADDLVAKGDRSGPRKHPERLPRGEAHYFRRHPERVLRGESCPWAKLSAGQVEEIGALFREGVSQSKIAQRFGINPSHVWKIVHGLRRSSG